MGVYINEMEMPKSCGYFPFKYRTMEGDECMFNARSTEYQKRPEDCPLVPVPPHGRLIDADALCKTLRSLAENEYTPEVFANWIENHIDSILEAEEGE